MGVFRIRHLPASVNASVFDWLRAHGKAVRPELSRAERDQLQVLQRFFLHLILVSSCTMVAASVRLPPWSARPGGCTHAIQI